MKHHPPFLVGTLLGALGLVAALGGTADAQTSCKGIWICPEEVATLPMQGPEWAALKDRADTTMRNPKIADQDDFGSIQAMAKALVHARTGDAAYRDETVRLIMDAIGTEAGGRTLALGRNLIGYVIAADLVGLPAPEQERFTTWLRGSVDRRLDRSTLRSTHETRPNNWGTHAGASRLAVALYLDDASEVKRVAQVFRGWLGDRSAYAGFLFGAPDWQADPSAPTAINPKGAQRNGHSIDGVLPDEQRRCCDGFVWPPPGENYVYEGLQGALAQAVMLYRAGYEDVWDWQDQALLRAFTWLHDEADYPAEGDDTWQPYLINYYYKTAFPTERPSRPGKNVGFTDWTHGHASADPATSSR